MKKILILFDKIEQKSKVLGTDAGADIATFSDLVFLVDGKNLKVWVKGRNISEYKIVYIRKADHQLFSMAGSLAVSLEHLGIEFFDKAYGETGTYVDKFAQYLKLALKGLPTITTLFCKREMLEKTIKRFNKEFKYPLIVKEINTQKGVGVYKIKNISGLKNLPLKNKKGESAQYLVQKYENLVREFRLLVLGDKVVLCNENIITKKGEFRHNAYLGASYVYLDLETVPSEMKDIAVKAAKAVNLQIAGVDIGINDKGGYLLLEVNRGPGFEEKENKELSLFFRDILNFK